jgi:two-component system response regulator AtoC
MHLGSDDPTKGRDLVASGFQLFLFWEGGSEAYPVRPDARLVVGRGDDCDLRVPHASVSRRHAIITGSAGIWHIEDLESSNGTFVGGVRLGKAAERVEPGMVVMLGDARLILDGGAPSPATPRKREEGPDQPMDRVARLVDLVADSALPILLLGETGVGKGHLAEDIHRRSSRANAPFVRLNCAAVPESLLESQLFGHERGAFTGAVHAKPGILETADRGTVFLDEIAELARATQAKLLHVLEHNEVLPVGGLRPRPIDVRFVAATNCDVQSLLHDGHFRRDLYFRIAGVPLLVPPLRERSSEIPGLVRRFVDEVCSRSRRAAPAISAEAIKTLMGYAWPGNIRELRNVVTRAALLCGNGPMLVEHLLLDTGAPVTHVGLPLPSQAPLPKDTMIPEAPKTLGDELLNFERRCVLDALDAFGGHQGKAAEHMGITRRTLTNKLNKLALPRPRKDKRKTKP